MVAAAACSGLVACDIPTGLPRVETRYIVPGTTVRLGVEQLLPAAVEVGDGVFRVAVAPVDLPRRTLGDLCGDPCRTLEGQTVPKPPFSATLGTSVVLPAGLLSATLSGGSASVSLTHDFGFDPLLPSGRSDDGHVTITVRSGGRTLGAATITGAFPSGSTRTAEVALTPGGIVDPLEVTVRIESPAGGSDPAHHVTVRNDAALWGVVAPGVVELSAAWVTAAGTSLHAAATIDLSGVDWAVIRRVRRGAFVLAVENPFDVSSGPLTLRLTAPGTELVRTVELAPGSTVQRVALDGAELRSLLGQVVTLTLSGTVEAEGPVGVRPGDTIVVTATLDITLELGPEG
jgi:hypothetical protein